MGIKKELLVKPTGDPFTDVGGYVIASLQKEWRSDDVLFLIEKLAKIYVDKWGAGQLSSFFLNSKITQPAFNDTKKVSETIAYYKRLLQDAEPHGYGFCRITGVKTNLFNAGRDNHILSGSNTFINFNHGFETGLKIAKEVLIRMFFVPFGCAFLNDKIAVINSNDEGLAQKFVRQNVEDNLRSLGIGKIDGVNRLKYRSPSSALFDFALMWIKESRESGDRPTEVNLFHFTNFGASPTVDLFKFASELFLFYKEMQNRKYQREWQKFANSYFRQKGAKFQAQDDVFQVEEKNEATIADYEEFKTWNNSLYDKLLAGKSILKEILNWVSKTEPGYSLNWQIIKLYFIKLQDMSENKLTIIERIADFVLSDENSLKKNINLIKKADKPFMLRNALIKLEEKNLGEKNERPLFTLKEYAMDLFPDGEYWLDVKGLLLVAIYQKMHERDIFIDSPEEEVEIQD